MQTAENAAIRKRISNGPSILLLAASERAPAFEQQMRILEEQAEEFESRGVIVACLFGEGESSVGTDRLDRAVASDLRKRFLDSDEDFLIVLLGEGGSVIRSDDAPLQGSAILRAFAEA